MKTGVKSVFDALFRDFADFIRSSNTKGVASHHSKVGHKEYGT